jgi:chloramphenicol 3-O phosphotransferase
MPCALRKPARIVFLNGVGSAGKGSIAKTLQAITSEPYLHVEMDAFVQMLPEASFTHPSGMLFETVYENNKPQVVIKTGPVGARALRGMRYAIAAMAAQGNNLIIDEVMSGHESIERAEYAKLLKPFEVFMVGVLASLDILEARELQRGDRMIGLARWQYDRVHKDMKYDLVIDTDNITPVEGAKKIKQKFDL